MAKKKKWYEYLYTYHPAYQVYKVWADAKKAEKKSSEKINKLVDQGGLGYSPEEMQAQRNQLTDVINMLSQRAGQRMDINATQRGIFDSPIAVGQRAGAQADLEARLPALLAELGLENRRMKNSSLLDLLGTQYGIAKQNTQDIERGIKSGAMAAYNVYAPSGIDYSAYGL
jgi:hypothetical protein